MRGTLLIFSGPSGVGKGTVVKELRRRSDRIRLSVSATTRKPRPEDVEGVTYYFKTMEEFEAMIGRDEFLEHAVYSGNRYGTPPAPWTSCSTRDATWCWRSRCRAPCR